MRQRPRRSATLATALLLVSVLGVGPAASQGESFGITPGRIAIPDGQPGQPYLRTVTIQNQVDSQSTITVEREGAAGGWTTTEPGSGFTIPARSSRQVTLTIDVPVAQGPGSHEGLVRFTTEPKGQVSGSGEQLRYAVAVLLNVTVGGQAVRHITWGEASIEDAQEGQPVVAHVLATNQGNVADDAVVAGTVLPFDAAAPVLREAQGRATLRPGETGGITVTFAAGLPVGQYRAQLRSSQVDPLDTMLAFKVFAAGTQAPAGTFRGINHEPFGLVGQPVRLDAWFENTGNVPVAAAKFKAEVRQDGRLLAALESDALAVAPHQQVNLTVYWTAPAAGTYLVNGTVLYDGYLTLPAQSILHVKDVAGAGGAFPWWWLIVLGVLVVGLVVYFVLRRREPEETKQRRAPSDPGRRR